jgi:bla regulator protein BlaR1
MVEERERACDEEVLGMGSQPRVYADAILNVCKLYVESPVAGVSGIAGADLKKRIVAIMNSRVANELSLAKKAALALVTFAVLALPIVVGIITAPAITAQSGDPVTAKFEVASIRPATQDSNHDFDSDRGRCVVHNFTLKHLIAQAYDIYPGLISGGPKWVDTDSFDINAKIPEEFAQPSHDVVPLMVQSLLADRFQLVVHREPRQVSGYELVVIEKGSKLQRAKPDAKGSNLHTNNTHLKAENVTMTAFAKSLSRNHDVGKLVVDKTGLTDGFNFELDWVSEKLASNADGSSADPPLIFTALQEQVGLKLRPAKITVPAIVIDRAEKPSEN